MLLDLTTPQACPLRASTRECRHPQSTLELCVPFDVFPDDCPLRKAGLFVRIEPSRRAARPKLEVVK